MLCIRLSPAMAMGLLLTYIAGYLVLADPVQCAEGRAGGCTTWTEPGYHVGGRTAEVLFRPLEQLDRQVRSGFWATRRTSYKASASAVIEPARD